MAQGWEPVEDPASQWEPVDYVADRPGMPPNAAETQMKDQSARGALGADLASGLLLKGVPKTAYGAFETMGADPNSEGMRNMHEYIQPANEDEAMGQTAEQVAEFAGGGEAVGALAKLAKIKKLAQLQKLSQLSKYLPQLANRGLPIAARIGGEALSTGGINALHGGDFSTGAMTGAATGTVGSLAKAFAPTALPKMARYGAGGVGAFGGYDLLKGDYEGAKDKALKALALYMLSRPQVGRAVGAVGGNPLMTEGAGGAGLEAIRPLFGTR